MVSRRMRYELRVETLVSRPALATFRVGVSPTDVPRNTVYRFRVPADRDPTDLLHRLTECDVQVLEIRRCLEPSRRDRPPVPVRQEDAPTEAGDPAPTAAGVVIPFPRTSTYSPDIDPAMGAGSPADPGLELEGNGPAV